jgi:steroid delta-isomerase-like uncharacterized protein
MSETNKAALRRFYEEVFNQGDLDVLDELTTADFLDHDPGNPTHDRDGVKRVAAAIRAAFPDVHFTADDVLADGEKVVGRFTMRGTHRGEFLGVPATGSPVTVTGMDIVRFSHGRAVEHWHEWSGLGLMRQLGVM